MGFAGNRVAEMGWIRLRIMARKGNSTSCSLYLLEHNTFRHEVQLIHFPSHDNVLYTWHSILMQIEFFGNSFTN